MMVYVNQLCEHVGHGEWNAPSKSHMVQDPGAALKKIGTQGIFITRVLKNKAKMPANEVRPEQAVKGQKYGHCKRCRSCVFIGSAKSRGTSSVVIN
jgi:hypothetical protein